MKYDLNNVMSQFSVYGEYLIGVPYGTGHINDTFQVTFDQGGTIVHYILQRVNTNVFRKPEELMENFVRVTGHIGRKIREERKLHPETRHRTLEVVPARDGKPSAVTSSSKTPAPTISSKPPIRPIRRRPHSADSRRISPISTADFTRRSRTSTTRPPGWPRWNRR